MMSASASTPRPNARRNTHSAAASSSQLNAAHMATRASSWRSAARSSRRPPTWRTAAPARSSSRPHLASDPAQDPLGPPCALHQTEDERRGPAHDDDASHGRRAVQLVHAADRDRDDQAEPEDDVEHHGRTEAGGGEREPGVGALDTGQGEQPVAERGTGRAAAGHDAAQRLGAHLDAEQAESGELAWRRRRARPWSAASSRTARPPRAADPVRAASGFTWRSSSAALRKPGISGRTKNQRISDDRRPP